MNQYFSHLLRVRYSECDAQQVVFNAKYAEYADIAITEYMRAIWGGYHKLLERGLDSQVVDMHIKWQAPALFDDVVEIQVQTKKIGNTSYTFQADFYNYASGRALASATLTNVMVTKEGHEKISIPDDIRITLEKGAPGEVSNHAGIILKE